MANKYAGEVTIHLDRVRTLRFTMNARASFQTEMGISIPVLFSKLSDFERLPPMQRAELLMRTFGDREVRALLWSALLHDNPRMTLEEAGDIFGAGLDGPDADPNARMMDVIMKLAEAWALHLGSAAKKQKADDQKGNPTVEESHPMTIGTTSK